jgi:subtilisin family serine protease
MLVLIRLMLVLILLPLPVSADDSTRQLLVTFKNENAKYQSAGFQPPYRARKRYAVAASVRRDARAIADEYSLIELEQWPLKSLSVYCYVFEIQSGRSEGVVAALSIDARVDSAQWLNTFQTQSGKETTYDDTYASMQHGLDTISLAQAHSYSRGEGVRVAVVDSDADHNHEDLSGSIKRIDYLTHASYERDQQHGTAVASIIGASANNALGMVGVAPAASLEVSEACWLDENSAQAVCDTFSLAKALDAMFEKPPDIINLSLSGPEDLLLQRILQGLIDQGAIVVAAASNTDSSTMEFPASMPGVISVASIGTDNQQMLTKTVYAPGNEILVAVPSDDYEFKSGNSLAAAHVSGIVALLKAKFPQTSADEVREILTASQSNLETGHVSVNACRVLELAQPSISCN